MYSWSELPSEPSASRCRLDVDCWLCADPCDWARSGPKRSASISSSSMGGAHEDCGVGSFDSSCSSSRAWALGRPGTVLTFTSPFSSMIPRLFRSSWRSHCASACDSRSCASASAFLRCRASSFAETPGECWWSSAGALFRRRPRRVSNSWRRSPISLRRQVMISASSPAPEADGIVTALPASSAARRATSAASAGVVSEPPRLGT
mmetsp:Transcript_65704/g.192694  ORF Transcript_65704/g.192694 Transcript_65704/m.192694 type:complete len:206 (-) Transcript_65704:71-688(-)